MRQNILLQKFLKLPPIAGLLELSKRIRLPGFDRLPLYDVALFFYQGVSKGALTSRASSIAFNFFLALFPGILVFFTVIPYLPVHDLQQSVMTVLGDLIPEHAFITLESTIRDILTRQRGGLLSVGFVMALYFSTNGINSIIEAFNMTIHTTDQRPMVKQRLIAILLVLILATLTILATILIAGGTVALDFLKARNLLISGTYYYMILAGKWLVIIALIYFGISFIYYYAPGKLMRFRFFSAGSSLATGLTVLTSLGFDYYVSNFSRYNALYGSIGTLIILMLWIYFNAIILLIGFELNTSILEAGLNKEDSD